jgi:hypothetical protein
VTAGGPEIPETLRRQLKIGGRLVIPIGTLTRAQRLVKVVRDGENEFHEEDLGAVMFVPLIGAHGWSERAADGGEVRAENQRAAGACACARRFAARGGRAIAPSRRSGLRPIVRPVRGCPRRAAR